jgi:uncharacterized membrane protein
MRRETIHRLFNVGIVVKGVDAVLEIVGGILFLLSPHSVTGVVAALTAHELARKPDNWIAHSAERWLENLTSDTQHFVSGYLILHGLIKILLVIGLLKQKLWAFPTSIAFLSLFVVYQFYRYSHTRSLTLLVFALMDVIIVVLIAREYQFRRAGI